MTDQLGERDAGKTLNASQKLFLLFPRPRFQHDDDAARRFVDAVDFDTVERGKGGGTRLNLLGSRPHEDS